MSEIAKLENDLKDIQEDLKKKSRFSDYLASVVEHESDQFEEITDILNR